MPATLGKFDALAADNVALALLPKRTEQRVVLVAERSLFLRKALEVNALVNLQVTAAVPEQFDPGVLYVFHRVTPAKMPAAQCLVIDPQAGSDLWQVGEKLENPIVTKQDADSPLMRHVRLDNVLLPEARQITPPAGHQALVTALSGDPLYFAVEEPGRKVLVLTVNLDQGDLTFRTAFPILVTNALGWFAGQSGELRESLASGAVTEVVLPAGRGQELLALEKPDGARLPLPRGLAKTSIGPLDQCGIWRVVPNVAGTLRVPSNENGSSIANDGTRSVPTTLELACNLASRAESDLRVPEKLLANRAPPSLAASWLARPIWFYLVAAAWLLAAVEWFLYHRRWIS